MINNNIHTFYSTNILIANLALADLLFLTLCPPISAYAYLYGWKFSESLCYITVSLQYVTCYVSVWTLVLLAYDRYLSISSPTRIKSIRHGNTVNYVCIILWILPFLLNLPQMRNVGVLAFEYNGNEQMVCVDSKEIAMEQSTITSARIFYWFFNILAYVLPLTITTILYFLLVRILWKQKLVNSRSSVRIKKHATKMVFVVIITFALCWLPQNIRFFLRGLNYPRLSFWEYDTKLLITVQATAQILAYANSCINPILYGALSERFRAGLDITFQRLFLCKKIKPIYANRSILSPLRYGSSLNPSKMPSPVDEISKNTIEKEENSFDCLKTPKFNKYTSKICLNNDNNDDGDMVLL